MFSRNIQFFRNVLLTSQVKNIATESFNSTKDTKPGLFRFAVIGVSVGALVGTGFSIHKLNKPKTHLVNEESVLSVIKSVPKLEPSKVIKISTDVSGLKLTLYQYQTCPFCCKVRAFLDYYGISYNIIEVDPVLRQALKWSPYKKVPLLLNKSEDGYQPLQDSTMIISALASYMQDKETLLSIVKFYPTLKYQDQNGAEKMEIMNKYFLMYGNDVKQSRTTEDIIEERKWRQWADDVLVHDLSPNVYRTWSESLETFRWFSDVGDWKKHFPAWERYMIVYVGAVAMLLIGKRLKKRHNLKDDVRESLYADCVQWTQHIREKGTPFAGGNEPNLADLAVYGVLNSIEGCAAFTDLREHTNIGEWYANMREVVRAHKGSSFA